MRRRAREVVGFGLWSRAVERAALEPEFVINA